MRFPAFLRRTLAAWTALLLSASAQTPPPVPWDEVRRLAQEFVARESPPSAWPFARADRSAPGFGARPVFAHYFLPYPLSFDNRPAADDRYSRVFLSPEGSDRELAGHGGYQAGSGGALRERPLPVGPWNTPYWRQVNFAVDILRARELGLDGFTCDLLQVIPGPLWDDFTMLMDTAAAVAPDFHIVPMPDMASIQKSKDRVADALAAAARHPAAYRLPDGRMLAAPFSAQTPGAVYWRGILADLEGRGARVALLPVFVGFGNLARNGADFGPFSYGLSDWGFRDIAFAEQFGFADAARRAAPYSPVWMMPVAPQDVRPKKLVAWEAGNTAAFRYFWDAAIAGGSRMVQVATWNDYSESSEISPSSGTQYLFHDLTAYYTAWFKAGAPPAILRDAIYYCHRTQIVPLPGGAPGQSRPFSASGKTPFRNEVEMVALLTAPATLEIELGGKVARREAPAGLSAFSVPAGIGQPVFRIVRDGALRVETRSAWTIADRGQVENPVYFGGSSTRSPAP